MLESKLEGKVYSSFKDFDLEFLIAEGIKAEEIYKSC